MCTAVLSKLAKVLQENLPAEFLCDHDPSLGTLRTMLTWCDIMLRHAGLCKRWSWQSQCQDSGCLSFSDLQHCQVHTGRTVPEEVQSLSQVFASLWQPAGHFHMVHTWKRAKEERGIQIKYLNGKMRKRSSKHILDILVTGIKVNRSHALSCTEYRAQTRWCAVCCGEVCRSAQRNFFLTPSAFLNIIVEIHDAQISAGTPAKQCIWHFAV